MSSYKPKSTAMKKLKAKANKIQKDLEKLRAAMVNSAGEATNPKSKNKGKTVQYQPRVPANRRKPTGKQLRKI